MKSQDTTATLGNISACPPSTVMVPLDVENLIDVGAISLEIGYDTNHLDFTSLENIYAPLQGGLLYNTVGSVVTVTWSSLAPINLASGKLFDLNFDYLSDSSGLHFEYIEIANSQLQILNVDTTAGGVYHQITISTQPDSIQAYPGSNVNFLVIAGGNNDYQWQENTGSGWTDLTNGGGYSGVNTNLLTISSVPLSYNGNTYRCLIEDGDCQNISDIALLEVAEAFPEATIGTTTSCPEEEISEPVLVNDFNDIIEFTFNIEFEEDVLEFIDLQNINTLLSNGNLNTVTTSNPNGISITWDNSSPVNFGETLLFDLHFDFNEGNTMLTFGAGSEAINSFGNPIDINLVDGEVEQLPVPEITMSPVNDSVEAGQSASFSIEALNAVEYQWQVSTNNSISWDDLVNDPPYSGVTTQNLNISNTPLSFDGHLYRCYAFSEECNSRSGFARLIVDTATGIVEATDSKDIIKVYPLPSSGDLSIEILEGTGYLANLLISDLSGRLLYNGERYLNTGTNDLDMNAYPDGFYLLTIKKINSTYNAEVFRQKILLSR